MFDGDEGGFKGGVILQESLRRRMEREIRIMKLERNFDSIVGLLSLQ